MNIPEIIATNKHIDYLTAVKLKAWLLNVIIPYPSDGGHEEEVIRILNRCSKAYNASKGNLLHYLKRTISLDMIKFNQGLRVPNLSLSSYDLLDTEVKLSNFSDSEITSLYNVSIGKGSQEDIKLVKGLVDE